MRMLLIEDNPDHALITKNVLKKTYQHYELDVASTANEGLDKIFRDNYDLILSDFNLPGLTALDILKEMTSKGKKTPFIVATSAGNEKTAVALMREGAYDYILKDFSYEETLPMVINRSLERHQGRIIKERLEEKISFQAQLLNQVNNAIIAINQERKIVFWNRCAEDYFQWKNEEVIGRYINEWIDDHETKASLDKIIIDTWSNGRWTGDFYGHRKDGVEFATFLTCSVVKDSQAEAIGFVGVFIDIAERKRFEESLLQGKNELELSVEDMNKRLTAANEQLRAEIMERRQAEKDVKEAFDQLKQAQAQLVQSEKMAAVGQLASGVAHEINNPLTGILNNAQLIKKEIEQEKEFKVQDFIEIMGHIEGSAVRCQKITRSLLDFSRASKDVFQAVSLNEAVEKVSPLVERELTLENIAFERKLQPGLPQVTGDFQQLQQVIFNLISNARWAVVKKSGRAGGSVCVSTEFKPEESKVYLSVSDTGVGISAENMNRLFEPFFTTKPIGEGTGLGLAIIYKIIKDHKGEVCVESPAGRGATFIISMPVFPEGGKQ